MSALSVKCTEPAPNTLPVRAAILNVLHAGAIGTFEAIAACAGVPVPLARGVMHQLRYGGRVVVVARQHNPERAGRPRAVYALQRHGPHGGAGPMDGPVDTPVDVLAHARQCWR